MKSLNNLELAEFCNHIAMMLRAGISIYEALTLLLEDAANEEEADILKAMIEHMDAHGYFYDAAFSVKIFPEYALQMIKLGEETGTLDKIMLALSDHYTREENISSMLKSALTYPAIMLGMMLLIIVLLLTKIMPIFSQVFAQLGQEMTGISATLLQIGNSLSRYGIFFVILLILFGIMIYKNRTKLPFQKNIQRQIACCRFCDGMSVALKSGLTPEASLELAEKLVSDEYLKKDIEQCKSLVLQGDDLHDALKTTGILTGAYARIAHIAGKAGTLDEAMEKIASEYEHTTYSKIHSVIGMLEPVLVIILTLIVGAILFSVMLPLLGIMSSL